jgi:hypothetical protein
MLLNYWNGIIPMHRSAYFEDIHRLPVPVVAVTIPFPGVFLLFSAHLGHSWVAFVLYLAF